MKSKGAVNSSSRSSSSRTPSKDSKKERIFKVLSEILTDGGYVIRREELKRGFGWKAVSGACRLEDSRILFVDRRMSQDDQLVFLSGRIVSLGLAPSEEQSRHLQELEWSLGTEAQENRV